MSIVQQSWVPFKFQIHKTDANPAQTFRQLISLYWVGIIMLWGIFSLLTPWLYHWLIDPKYWSGIPYVPFIMGISLAQAIYFMVTTGFELSTRQRLVVRASFLSMVCMIGLSLLTMDFYTPYSFILAQALAYLIMGAVLFPEAQKVLKIKYPFFILQLLLAATIGIVALLYNQEEIPVRLLGLLGILVLGLFTVKVLFPRFSPTLFFPKTLKNPA